MDAYREEYENYEPDLKVWPFILLGFLVPLVPFVCNILLANIGVGIGYNLLLCIFDYLIIAAAFFVTAHVVRTSHKSWILALEGGIYFLIQLGFWSFYKLDGVVGYPLGLPFVIAIIPSFLLLLAYAFYAKRSRLPAWGTCSLLSMFLGILFFVYIYLTSTPIDVIAITYLIFSALLVVLSLLTMFVTKRSEVAPWYINIILVLFVFTSLFISPSFPDVLAGEINIGTISTYLLQSIATNYVLWLLISLCFIYAGLAMKSCFKSVRSASDSVNTQAFSSQSIPPQDNSYQNVPYKARQNQGGYNSYQSNYDEQNNYDNQNNYVYPNSGSGSSARSNYAFPSSSQDRFSERKGGYQPRYREDDRGEYLDYERDSYRGQYKEYKEQYKERGYAPQSDEYSSRYEAPRSDRDYYQDDDRFYDDSDYDD